MSDTTAHSDRDPEAFEIFVEESFEGLARVESLLLSAEAGEPPRDMLTVMFRDLHTIKGTASFLDLPRITSLAHAAEDLMARMRDGVLAPDREISGMLLRVVDVLRTMITEARATGDEAHGDAEGLTAKLRERLERPAQRPRSGAPRSTPRTANPPAAPSAPPVVAPAPVVPAAAAPAPVAPMRRTVMPQPAPEPRPEPTRAGREGAEAGAPAGRRDPADGSLRVNVAVLDRLMNLMEELVLARNQMVALSKTSGDGAAMAAAQRLSNVTSDLQEQVMRTRMQPVARVFEKIPRMVRDLCEVTGKRAVCEVEDNGTEIDKAIVEAVRDPVMHIVRNAMDHGIESPEQRVARGKSEVGLLCVRAAHQGGMVVIEVEDDGGGIDAERVRKIAVQRGVITQAQSDRLTEREAVELIFRPGFSTAQAVTSISGRGVGMDVVRTQVERAGGQVEIDSAVGRGSTIRLKLPLTLAIFPALLVRSCGQRFAIPQVNLLELVYVDEEQRARTVERVRGADVIRLRGDVLPLLYLDEVLGRRRSVASEFYVVIVSVSARRYGLVVDRIDDTEEIVIKTLHGQLKRLSCYAGATVIGDGSVALILDVAGVAQQAGLDVGSGGGGDYDVERVGAPGETQALVVARIGANAQVAVPLSLVARLEEVERRLIERVAGEELLQYRGEVMPVVRPEDVLPLGRPQEGHELQRLIVFEFAEKAALAVDEIVDIIDAPLHADDADVAAPMTLGRVPVLGRTTTLLDPYAIFQSRCPRVVLERSQRARRVRVVLVDDSSAMRAATSAWLRARGVDALEFSAGQEALWHLRTHGTHRIDAVVTDFVMPDLDGAAFTETLRREGVQLPVFIWTHSSDPKTEAAAVRAGASACVLKSQRETLLELLRGLSSRPHSARAA